MFLEQKWNILIVAILGLVALMSYNQNRFKCPDEYETSEELLASLTRWTDDFYDKNPDASIGDWADARQVFYRQNDCKEALQRSADYDSGNADPVAKKRIDDAVDKALLDLK